MSLSRREFLQKIIPNQPLKIQSSTRHEIGHLSVFPVGTTSFISIEDQKYVLKSLPQGVQLIRLTSGENIQLFLGQNGQIGVDLSKTWNTNSAMSLFSGEEINI